MTSGPEVQRFCKECGTALDGAKFCPQCGTVTENAGRHAGFSPSSPEPEGRRAMRWRWLAAGGVVAVVVIGLVAALVLVRQSPSGPSYVTQARRALAPVVQENRQLTRALSTLPARGDPGQAKGSVQTTIAATRSAQRSLGRLNPDAASRPFAGKARAALAGELAWLTAAGSVLRDPACPMLGQLGSLGVDARTKLQAIDAQVAAASSSLPGSSRIISYAQARNNAVSTRRDLRQFTDQAQALLAQSGPAFEQINRLFGQMQTAASGGTPTITLAQAEATIGAVISNRTALAASARTLRAPTPMAVTVRAGLVAAMDASLTNDHDISDCLNQANNGTVAIIFQSCLASTAADSTAATSAKQHFLAVYNALRRQIGQPATSVQF